MKITKEKFKKIVIIAAIILVPGGGITALSVWIYKKFKKKDEEKQDENK